MANYRATVKFFADDLKMYAEIKTRNSSRDEIANVNFLYDDTVHALKMQ